MVNPAVIAQAGRPKSNNNLYYSANKAMFGNLCHVACYRDISVAEGGRCGNGRD